MSIVSEVGICPVAETNVRSVFPILQSLHEVIRFSWSSVPPLLFGTIWSTSNFTESSVIERPQYLHLKPSRDKIENRNLYHGSICIAFSSFSLLALIEHDVLQYFCQALLGLNVLLQVGHFLNGRIFTGWRLAYHAIRHVSEQKDVPVCALNFL